ncbi:MAG: hypothetical protein NC211_00880 [Alistipes senegalensis]|nr:hypothetical protein [Oxalobacter formigenes]MCM1280379.1 hypothetical protein [Alistipes senegalensis]
MAMEEKSLAARRQELLVKSALLREQFASGLEEVWRPGAAVFSGKGLLARAAGKKPLLSGALALAAFLFLRKRVSGFFRRRSLFSLVATGVMAFKTWSRFAPYLLPVIGRIRQLAGKGQPRR